MIKIIQEKYNNSDLIELFYDTNLKNYIFIINGNKKIIRGGKYEN